MSTRKKTGPGKLVRDKISDFPGHSSHITFHELAPVSVPSALFDKLYEEVGELEQAVGPERFIEEMGDVIEVLRALMHRMGIKAKQIEDARLKKLEEKGGFKKGIYMMTECVKED